MRFTLPVLLAMACADPVPGLRAEIAVVSDRADTLTRELDRLNTQNKALDQRVVLLEGRIETLAAPPIPASQMAGTWGGTATNETYGIASDMVLVLAVDLSQTLTGGVTITGKLEGSGVVSGQVQGNRVAFSSKGDTFATDWTGTLTGDTLAGTYDVPKVGAKRPQHGTWSVTLLKR